MKMIRMRMRMRIWMKLVEDSRGNTMVDNNRKRRDTRNVREATAGYTSFRFFEGGTAILSSLSKSS